MYEYLLYEWHGKIKWVFYQDIFLFDPLFETEFLQQNEDRHLRPDLYLKIN